MKMTNMATCTVFLVLFVLFRISWTFPTGAPSSACTSMIPGHIGISPQDSVTPFLVITVAEYQPNERITVTILSPGSDQFGGILLQARRVGSSDTTPVGTWDDLPTNTRLLACSSDGDSVTHSSSTAKPNPSSFTWVAPSVGVGSIEFVATIAVNHDVYWTGVKSTVLSQATGCITNPCQNGATCSPFTESSGYTCTCPENYAGSNCETYVPVVEACDANPCLNGATCFQSPIDPNAFSCECPPTHQGIYCENEVADNVCDSSPCQNNGTCYRPFSQLSTYVCVCSDGYIGTNCDEVEPCTPNPCLNGGDCYASFAGPSSYICDCASGYEGTNCENEVTEDACDPNPCQNGGVCLKNFGDPAAYTCDCPAGYIGANCQLSEVPACDSNPCQNGATCADTTGGYYNCTCAAGYTGLKCENEIIVDELVCKCSAPACSAEQETCFADGSCYTTSTGGTGNSTVYGCMSSPQAAIFCSDEYPSFVCCYTDNCNADLTAPTTVAVTTGLPFFTTAAPISTEAPVPTTAALTTPGFKCKILYRLLLLFH
ncbi:uncharacterized protein LOC144435340 [Glandiceps talaboti]